MTMKSSTETYNAPAVSMLMLETEQMVCVHSNFGGNEDLFDDPDNYEGIF